MALANIARNIEDAWNRRGIVKRRNEGWLPSITPYMGYGNVNEVRIFARALMADPNDTPPFSLRVMQQASEAFSSRSLRDVATRANAATAEAQRGWRQFFTTQVGFLPVKVKVGEKVYETRTDRSGYIEILIQDHGLEPGWHEAEIIPVQGQPAIAPIMIVSPNAKLGLVSDIDDTIVVTWLPRALLAAWNSFVVHTNTRQPVAGMAKFYEEMLSSDPDAPVFYLSTGAWNTYSTMLKFIEENHLPLGPLIMTDWGPTPTGIFRSGQEHKKTQLRNLLIMFPEINWVLVGDDGQHDPLIYDDLARDHPQNVRGIALRELNPVEQVLSHGTTEPAEASRQDSDIERHGAPVIRGKDGLALLNEWRTHAKGEGAGDEPPPDDDVTHEEEAAAHESGE